MGLLGQFLFLAEGGVYPAGAVSSGGPVTSVSDCGATAAAEHRVSLSGWLHIIWNGEPRFMFIDDRGAAIRLIIDETLIRAFGGPQGLNQKRVTIAGERVDETPEVVRVLSIELDMKGK